MDLKRLADSLHSLEKKVLPLVAKHPNFQDLVKNSNLSGVEVMRALQWLENKEVLKIKTKEISVVSLTDKGKNYKELPERAILNNLGEKEISLDELKNKAKLNHVEVNACIGLLKRKNAIDIIKGKVLKIKLTKKGKELVKNKTPEEALFRILLNNDLNLDNVDKNAFEILKQRGLVVLEKNKERSIELTKLGKDLSKQKLDLNVIEALTSDVLKNKEWKNKKFRSYDIKINVPSINRGKRHFVDQGIEYAKRVWLDLGFEEMEGGIVQTSFWNLDTLFIPQDHAARDMQDTFFIGNKGKVLKGKLPNKFPEIIKKVHDNGWTTGSKGWGGKWNPEIAKEVLLRTHTTALSALSLSKLKKEDLPKKYFKVGRVYRNESLDWKHLFEFYQVDGIVVDPDANFRHLMGYLKEFYRKMGFDKIKLKPSFYPYTSPSMDVVVWNPIKKQWVETGGSGVFRPEVTKALLGFECPVLAWGQGFERILIEYYKIKDLRHVYDNDLKRLREVKEFVK